MQYGKTLKILICLLLIIPILNTGQASANTNYDHDALMEYEGYGKAMYETIVEQTTFVSGQYTDNKQYIKDSWQSIKDYANWAYDNLSQVSGKCGISNTARECLGEVVTTGGAAFLTVGDWVKNLFNDFDLNQNGPITSYPNYQDAFSACFYYDDWVLYDTASNCIVTVTSPNGQTRQLDSNNRAMYISYSGKNITAYVSGLGSTSDYVLEQMSTDIDAILKSQEYNSSFNSIFHGLYTAGFSFKITFNDQDLLPPSNNIFRPVARDISNYLKDNSVQLPVPTLKPQLVCPDGTKINMLVNGSTFLSQSGQVMQVNTDGTAQVLDQTCNLNWQKPTIDYVDDKPAITDLDGNWLDLLTGEMLECMLTGECKSSVPKENEEVEPLDGTLLSYVKNAYDYATGVLKTATDGLKSLATGAKDLTGLFGTFFSWLPSEMVVLMSSGLGIVIGLRLFRK